ncbi:MAG: glutamate--cysteine ligase, partial [Woeseiaceae bacterium]|nr:glutamate--cysteine ligase [Woeseiaceae bacterium]
MRTILEKRLMQLTANNEPVIFCGGKKGLEKESLRVNEEGSLSLKKHPISMGSALKNRYITTDFSEALLEFVTP